MPGAKLPITPIGNEPRWPGQRRSPISATGHAPDELFEEARQYFSEQELADLTLAVTAINGWNRISIAFQVVPATYQPPQLKKRA
jgi:hypothetical protein